MCYRDCLNKSVYEVKIGPFCSFKVQFVSLQIKARDLNLGLHQSIHKLRHDVNKYVMTSKLSYVIASKCTYKIRHNIKIYYDVEKFVKA